MRRSPRGSDAASGHCDKEMGRSVLRRLRRALANGVAIQPEVRQAEAAQRKALYENLVMVPHPDGNLIEIASYEWGLRNLRLGRAKLEWLTRAEPVRTTLPHAGRRGRRTVARRSGPQWSYRRS